MKEAKRIIVMSLGITLLAGIISQPTERTTAGTPDELRQVKAENKALRLQIESLQRQTKELKAELATLKTQNVGLEAEVARLKRGQIVSASKARTRPTTTKSNDEATVGIWVRALDAQALADFRKNKIPRPPVRGMLVQKPTPGGPAERAGIQCADILGILVDRKTVATVEGFRKWGKSLKIGQPTTVRVWRLEATSGSRGSWKQRLIKVVPKSRDEVMRMAKEHSMPPAVKKGTVSVRVAWAKIGKAVLENEITEARSVSEDKLLSIFVGIVNLSEERKLNYRTWGADPLKFVGGSARVTDDLGNVYKRIHFGVMDVPVGRRDQESIYPGKSILDVLIFELPVAKAKRLTLSLPLGNLGQQGSIEITIPVAAIERN